MAEHEQLFLGGMDKDSDISLQKINTYRDALNMRLISNDGNTFSIETIKGNASIVANRLVSESGVFISKGKLDPNYQIIGWTAGIDKVIIFSTNGSSDPAPAPYTDSNGEIGVFTITESNIGTYTPVYNHKDLNFNTGFQIEARLFTENPKIERTYWVEKHNPPRALNIANPVLYDYQSATDVQFSGGRSFMVLRGTVTQSGISYGPNVSYPSPSETVFVSDGTPVVYTNNPMVILYASSVDGSGAPSVESIDITPEKELGNIRYEKYFANEGQLFVGTYQYAYQLITSDGALSSWSYVTTPTPLTVDLPGDTFGSYQAYQGAPSTTPTTKAIAVLIEGIDTNYNRIRVAAVHATALGVTELPVVFFDGPVTGPTMEFIHRGGENIEILTVDDLKQILVSFKTVATLEIQKNRLFFGNVETSSLEFDFDPSENTGTVIKTIDYLVPSDLRGHPNGDVNYAGGDALSGHKQLLPNNTVIYTDQWYKVKGSNISYNGVEYGPNPPATTQYFKGVPGIHSYTASGGTPNTFHATKTVNQFHKSGVNTFVIFEDDSTGANFNNGGYVPATGLYTAPVNMNVRFQSSVIFETTNIPGTAHNVFIEIIKNGSGASPLAVVATTQPASTIVTYNLDTGFVNLIAGDTVQVFVTPLTDNAFINLGSTFQNEISGTAPGATVVAVIRIQKYTGTYDYIEFENDWADTKGMAVSTFLKSYWRGETYRFGILVWDKFGNPTFVRWMDDKEIPQQYDTIEPDSGALLNFTNENGDPSVVGFPGDARLAEVYYIPGDNPESVSLRHLGVRIDNLDLGQIATSLGVPLADLDQYIDGFSVVRAKRDPQIYAQALMFQTVRDDIDPITNNVYPVLWDASGDQFLYKTRQPNTFNVYAPDFLFQFNNTLPLVEGDYIRTVDYLYDLRKADPIRGSFEQSPGNYYEKYYSSIANPGGLTPDKGPSSDRDLDVSKGNHYNVNGSGTYGDGTFEFTNNIPGLFHVFSVGAQTQLIVTTIDNRWSDSGPYNGGFKPLVNFVRPNNNLYGGQSASSKANTQYMYCGHYQKMDADFMSYLVANAGKVSDVEVFGGDCFVNIFDIARMIKQDSTGESNRFSNGSLFPVECDMNTFLRENRHLAKDGSFQNGVGTSPNGVSFDPTGTDPDTGPGPEQFTYNAVFSYEEINVLYAALPVNFIQNEIFGYRIYYSNQKVNGEFFDSFKVFLTNNFIDVEGWAGSITNLRTKDGKLFYWQNHAFGYVPVNERITLSGGGGLGTPTTIGEGGVATRYDELKKYYGNQHQWGLCETEDSFVWFDMRRRAFCHANTGGGIVELSAIKGLMSFFVNDVHGNVVTHDNPVNKRGITAAYDSRFKEVLMVFKGISTPSDFVIIPDTHFTVGFNNLYKYFSGFYSFVPGNMIEFNNRLLSSFEGFQNSIQGSHDYIVGDIVTQTDKNYVNILAYTSAPVPVQPATDTTHWALVNSSEDIYLHNISDIGKFYGIVHDSSVTPILNMNRNIPKDFDNHVFLGCDNGNFFTDYIATNSFQTASDLGIVVSNRGEYQFINRAVYSTLPQDATTGRLVDQWLQVFLKKDNRLNGNILVSSNQYMKLVSLKTTFRAAI